MNTLTKRRSPGLSNRRTLLALIATLLLASTAFASAAVASPPVGFEKGADPDTWVPGQLLVRYSPGVSALDIEEHLGGEGLRLSRRVASRDGVPRFHRVELTSAASMESAIARLREDPRVISAEPNGHYRAFAPNDPECVDDPDPMGNLFWDQWGYYRVNADQAWDQQPGGAAQSLVTVAILDTGLDMDHPDAPVQTCSGGGCLRVNWTEVFGTPGVDDDLNGYIDDSYGLDLVRWEQGSGDVPGYDGDPDVYAADPDGSCGNGLNDDGNGGADDLVYHGTHVAGIVATWTNNSLMFAGGSWFAELIIVRVLSPEGVGSWADIAEGILYAADNGAHVINLSLGGGYSATVESAVQYAHGLGCVIVAAAGNDNEGTVDYPAALAETIAVGATDPDDARAWFSNWGPEIDVVAPGVRIFSNAVTSVANANASFPTGSPDYYWANGTSQATPMVTALAANWFTTCGPPSGGSLTNEDVRGWIRYSAHDLTGTWDGAGLIDFLPIPGPAPCAAPPAVDAPVVAASTGGPGSLRPSRPNPFGSTTPVTSLGFELPRDAQVRLEVFDLAGRRVRILEDRNLVAGSYDVPWDGRDGSGRPVASGIYLTRLTRWEDGIAAGSITETRKVTLLR